jgi:sugar phosphate isomerase/epimerase
MEIVASFFCSGRRGKDCEEMMEKEIRNLKHPQGASSDPTLQGPLPFRLGATSYIIEAGLVENARLLSGLVHDMELILFETKEMSNIPDRGILRALRSVALESGLSYTVHLPADVFFGHEDETERIRSVQWALKIIDITSCLDPIAYVVHFHGERRGRNPASDLSRWLSALERSIRTVLSSGIRPEMLCVETLDYPFSLIEGIVFRNSLSICLDIGHLAFYGYDVEEHLSRYLRRARVLHLHGHDNGSDHKALSLLNQDLLARVLCELEACPLAGRVATLEVFGLEDLEDSISCIRGICRRPAASTPIS